MSESLVIVGNGMAAAKLVEQLSARALGRYAIAVIGEEPQLAYNRVLLSSVLADEVAETDIELKSKRWWRDSGRHRALRPGRDQDRPLHKARPARKWRHHPLFETRIRNRLAPDPVADTRARTQRVMTFRDMRDVEALKSAGQCNAVVIGGGLLGLEAAYGLANAGAKVTVCTDGSSDGAPARRRSGRHAESSRGMTRHRRFAERGDGTLFRQRKVESVRAEGRPHLPADIVVMAAGIAPNVALAVPQELRSIAASSSTPGCRPISRHIRHRRMRRTSGHCFGLVEPAYEQARCSPTVSPAAARAMRAASRPQSESFRRQRVLRRRFSRRPRAPSRCSSAIADWASTRSLSCKRSPGRRVLFGDT